VTVRADVMAITKCSMPRHGFGRCDGHHEMVDSGVGAAMQTAR